MENKVYDNKEEYELGSQDTSCSKNVSAFGLIVEVHRPRQWSSVVGLTYTESHHTEQGPESITLGDLE